MFTLGHQNIQQPDRASDELKTIDRVHDYADLITWNEARDAHSAIRGLLGWDEVVAGGLAISWKADRFERVDAGQKRVMRGGHVGRDGTRRGPDNRRVGPSRFVLWVVLREVETNRHVLVATHHAIARADTKHKWRRRLRTRGFRGVVTELRSAARSHPGVPWLLTGDFNKIRWRIWVFFTAGLRQVNTPGTHGRLRYDRIFRRGRVKVANVRRIRTKSDHRGLLADVTLEG